MPPATPGQLAAGQGGGGGAEGPVRQTPARRPDPGAGSSPVPPALRREGECRLPPSNPALVCSLLSFSLASALRVGACRAKL